MRIILKLFAAPFVLALTLLVAALSFCVSIATWAFGIVQLFYFYSAFGWAGAAGSRCNDYGRNVFDRGCAICIGTSNFQPCQDI